MFSKGEDKRVGKGTLRASLSLFTVQTPLFPLLAFLKGDAEATVETTIARFEVVTPSRTH